MSSLPLLEREDTGNERDLYRLGSLACSDGTGRPDLSTNKEVSKDEMYGLTSQLRRAAVSVPSNIAEGKGRSSDKELIQFLCHARGSLFEIETQLRIMERLGYVRQDECDPLQAEVSRVGHMLNGLIRSVRPAA